jgi:hypothetical protein
VDEGTRDDNDDGNDIEATVKLILRICLFYVSEMWLVRMRIEAVE